MSISIIFECDTSGAVISSSGGGEAGGEQVAGSVFSLESVAEVAGRNGCTLRPRALGVERTSHVASFGAWQYGLRVDVEGEGSGAGREGGGAAERDGAVTLSNLLSILCAVAVTSAALSWLR